MSGLDQIQVGFIGAGNMAYSMVSGILKSGKVSANRIVVTAPSNNRLPRFGALGCTTSHNNDDVLPGGKHECSVVFLCVKPHILKNSIERGEPFFSASDSVVVVSILAGVPVADVVRGCTAPNSNYYRIMTNTACALGAAHCAIVKDPGSGTESTDQLVLDLCRTFGAAEFLPESLMDQFSGVVGSGIAFGYTIIQAMADGAVKMGIPRPQAVQMAAQTILGAARMVLDTGKHPIQLRDEVCSAGGSTICGVHELDRNAVPSGLILAIEAAVKRTSELGK